VSDLRGGHFFAPGAQLAAKCRGCPRVQNCPSRAGYKESAPLPPLIFFPYFRNEYQPGGLCPSAGTASKANDKCCNVQPAAS
jgi:hypothetical protein